MLLWVSYLTFMNIDVFIVISSFQDCFRDEVIQQMWKFLVHMKCELNDGLIMMITGVCICWWPGSKRPPVRTQWQYCRGLCEICILSWQSTNRYLLCDFPLSLIPVKITRPVKQNLLVLASLSSLLRETQLQLSLFKQVIRARKWQQVSQGWQMPVGNARGGAF